MANKKEVWTGIVFDGNPPKDYKSWSEFVEASIKTGVIIKATQEE